MFQWIPMTIKLEYAAWCVLRTHILWSRPNTREPLRNYAAHKDPHFVSRRPTDRNELAIPDKKIKTFVE